MHGTAEEGNAELCLRTHQQAAKYSSDSGKQTAEGPHGAAASSKTILPQGCGHGCLWKTHSTMTDEDSTSENSRQKSLSKESYVLSQSVRENMHVKHATMQILFDRMFWVSASG